MFYTVIRMLYLEFLRLISEGKHEVADLSMDLQLMLYL